MTKLAQLIGKEEGFGRTGTIPTTRHNPGDLRHSPHASHAGIGPNDIGIMQSDAQGFDDLERQLALFAHRGMSLRQCIEVYAPATENDTRQYLTFVCEGLKLGPDTSMADALKVMA